MVTKEAMVVNAIKNKVWVKTIRSKSCDSCDSKDSCGEGSQAQEVTVELENSLNACAGDRVVVGFKTAPLIKVTFMLYIFPIILLIVGAAIGDSLASKFGTDPSLTSLIFAMICFSMSFFVIKYMNNTLAKKNEYKPFLIRFAQKAQSCHTNL